MAKKKEMTEEKEAKKKFVEDHQREVRKKYLEEHLRNLNYAREWHIKQEKFYRSKADIMEGLILGLLLGIFGNLFVQYLYAFTEGLVAKGILVYSNTILFATAAVVLIVLLYRFRQQLKYAKEGVDIQKDGQVILKGSIADTEFELDDLEKNKTN
jgi:Flp pilus assembly protein TadB